MNKGDFNFFFVCIFTGILCTAFPANAAVRLPQLVSNHMVLQRNMHIKIWGWASPGEKLTVRFNGKKENTVSGTDHKWLVSFPPMKAGGPYTMIIQGKNEIALSDI